MKGVIFIGLQASGKSSFYLQEFYKTHVRINLDMLKTRARESALLEACLNTKQPVVIDNTNVTEADRERYLRKFREHRFSIDGYYFSSSIKECLVRNSSREGKDCIPDIAIKGTYNKLQLPKYAEGFDNLYFIRLDKEGFIKKEWQDEIR